VFFIYKPKPRNIQMGNGLTIFYTIRLTLGTLYIFSSLQYKKTHIRDGLYFG